MADANENEKQKGEKITRNIALLQKKFGPNMRCPMCGGIKFSVVDGFVRNDIQHNMNSFQLGGPFIPTVMAICVNCGFVSQHALSVLDQDSQENANG